MFSLDGIWSPMKPKFPTDLRVALLAPLLVLFFAVAAGSVVFQFGLRVFLVVALVLIVVWLVARASLMRRRRGRDARF